MKWLHLSLASILIGLLVFSCQPAREDSARQQVELAKVYNKTLYLSDLEGIIPGATTSEDSSVIIKAYIERWIRDASMMHEAERNVPKDLNIDKLVRDYRASLIVHNYEKLLIEQYLDSLVNQTELLEFYEKNKEQYRLENPIVRCRFAKIPADADELDKMEKWWESEDNEDFRLLVSYCDTYAAMHLLEDSTWYQWPAIAIQWPDESFNPEKAKLNQTITRKGDTFVYFLKISEVVPAGEVPPLSYAADQAKKVILHKRKMKLLDEKKEEIYERALRKNEIKVLN
jgi:hypothetical protein